MKKIIIVSILFLAVSWLAGCSPNNLPPNDSITPSTTEPSTSSVPDVTADWTIAADEARQLTFKYPAQLTATYLHGAEWPPKLTVASGDLRCPVTPAASSSPAFEQVVARIIGGRQYCVKSLAEGAAGSIYTTYTYSTAMAGQVITATFTIQTPQCVNYDDPQKTACESEQKNFSIDNLVDDIIGSVQLANTGNPAPVACTMEAKLCPDGSAVGRSGPNCEFAPCPGQ